MKKFLSIALALVMVLSLGVVAFADELAGSNDDQQAGGTVETPAWDGSYTATDEMVFKEIVKTYTNVPNGVKVNETLKFESKADTSNPDYVKNNDGTVTAANLIVEDLTITNDNFNVKAGENIPCLKVTIPSLSKEGTYKWKITEVDGTTPGVKYSNDEVYVIVYVGFDNEKHEYKILNTTSYIAKSTIGEKLDEFSNEFQYGSFTVEKDVIGNMADESQEFYIEVTLTSTYALGTDVSLGGVTVTPDMWNEVESDGVVTGYTYTSSLQYADLNGKGAKTFSNIPKGVTVSVSEPSNVVIDSVSTDNMHGYTNVGVYSGNYTVSGNTVNGNKFYGLTVGENTNAKITVVNNKSTNVETGVSMDSIPYVVLLTVACLGLVVLLTKKRTARDF